MGTDTFQVHWFCSTLQQLGDPLGSLGGTVNGIASTSDGEWCVVCTDAYCRIYCTDVSLNGTTGSEWTLVYASTSTTRTSTSTPSSTSIGAIVGGSIAASVIIAVIVAVILIIVIFILKKGPRQKVT